MISIPQHRRYLAYWSRAWKAHWAGVSHGEPLARPGRPPSEFREQVLQVANNLAAWKDRSLKPDDIRHACHIIALGSNPSSKHLTLKEQDLVIAVFQRLEESGQELAGQMRMDQRDQEMERRSTGAMEAMKGCGSAVPWESTRPDADRKRVVWSIEHSGYPLPAVAAISGSVFGTANWKSLPTTSLQKLLMTVKARARAKAARELAPKP